jgi:hypothetical protein
MLAAGPSTGSARNFLGILPAAVYRVHYSHAIALLLFAGSLLLGITALVPGDKAYAGCVITGSPDTTDNCTGNVSAGESYATPSSAANEPPDPPTNHTLNANTLNPNITPSSGNAGLSLTAVAAEGAGGTDGGVGIGTTGGNDGVSGNNLTLNYTQPGASAGSASSGAVVTVNASGLVVTSTGGNGGNGGNAYVAGNGRSGGYGGNGGTINVNAQGAISTSGDNAAGIVAASAGGNGGNGGDSAGLGGSGGNGTDGGHGGDVTVNVNGTTAIATNGMNANAITAKSQGGAGGSSGDCGGIYCSSNSSGNAAYGGAVSVTTAAGSSIVTHGTYSFGIYAASIGGFAGGGGSNYGIVAFGSSAASAGDGGQVTVTNAATITTYSDYSGAIQAQSIGGGGGNGGSAGGLGAVGASGSSGGSGGLVHVTNSATLSTGGVDSAGIYAQSIGGSGGDGGNSGGLYAMGGNGSATATGGTVIVSNTGGITTQGANSQAIFAQSIGGGGGSGGTTGGSFTFGGTGGGGGDGGSVTVSNGASLTTQGMNSVGLQAQSLGGGGGNGGNAVAASSGVLDVAMGGQGGNGGNGGTVSVGGTSGNPGYTVTTQGDNATGIEAQSFGGGGGNGGFAVSANVGSGGFSANVALGGQGGNGGAGGMVTLTTQAAVSTSGNSADGISAQSIGGGGGNGGFAVSAGAAAVSADFTLGGKGGLGGGAAAVSVTNNGDVTTGGVDSNGIIAQSLGGGGGKGGFSVTAGGGIVSATVGLGGQGGGGGVAGSVEVNSTGTITATGSQSAGIVAQSIGGGGGNGGFSVAGSFGVGLPGVPGGAAVSVSVGGSGGSGQDASTVNVDNSGNITTSGNNSQAIVAQSLGGGGGNGGFSVAASFTTATGTAGSAAVSIGGSGTGGGSAQTVILGSSGDLTTHGDESSAILAQSIGGGGGNGGFSISASGGSAAAAAVSVGGSASQGGSAALVSVDSVGNVTTTGQQSRGIEAESIGGGGGNGGFSVAGTLTTGIGAGSVSIGGSGGGAQNGSTANIYSNYGYATGTITTSGNDSSGIYAQSLGGGGGSGGFSGALSVGTSSNTFANIGVSVGGSGSTAGSGGIVNVFSNDNITTSGVGSNAIFAQSLGGGGGDGGQSMSVAFNPGAFSGALTASVGGNAGGGGSAGAVEVNSAGTLTTMAENSAAVFAQSVGGGGGTGGFSGAVSVTASPGLSANTNLSLGLAIGGKGGSGGDGGTVEVDRSGSIQTSAQNSQGILAQSVGGGGGNGGFAFAGGFGNTSTWNATFTLGGTGGSGGSGNTVDVNSQGSITTGGADSSAIEAQSIGRGGGNGGFSVAAGVGSGGMTMENINIGVAVGGVGGIGGAANAVTVTNNGQLTTSGDGSYGIEAQSLGGGGGNGGGTISVALGLKAGSPGNTVNASVAVGGNGGTGNMGGDVIVDQTGGITTTGAGAHGIFAESIGGGGGVGGRANSLAFALAAQCTLPVPVGGCGTPPSAGTNVNINIAVGGTGGSGNDAGTVDVHNHSSITTSGDSSAGIVALSIGGGGGEAGNGSVGLGGGLTNPIPVDLSNVLIPISSATPLSPKVAIGGQGGASGNGNTVTVIDDGAITTNNNNATGIDAESIGGGGGRGGNASPGLTGILGIGGQGGSSGNGGDVTVTLSSTGSITTSGSHSRGIFAQSVGGGGGEGGGDLLGIITIGGQGGSGGDGGMVTVTSNGSITTNGTFSEGVAAQSVGGGGGMANAISGVFAIGGQGGSAGGGGVIQVTNTGSITTNGVSSNAVFAQSIGGGGGAGAGANGVFSFGGSGGSTGDGGKVTVNNQSTGMITTNGDLSYGIYAQSVGGGGGGGGNVVSGSVIAGVSVGGAGGAAGSGGEVDVTNAGSITTYGQAALGIFAQSVGGGGGNGGYSGNYSGVIAYTVGVGGSGGASGDGGNVTVTNDATGTITTHGAASTAIFAQSVGGGGGQGAGAMTITAGGGANVAVGGMGANGGQGGTVTVTNNGSITTSGLNSVAIFAQSVGGGGGVAGSALAVTVGAPVFIGGSTGSNGKGGNVTVTNYGSITMTGAGSVGLFAQSVGGGGGVATADGAASYALSAQGDGNGGAVSVVNHGTISITGDNSAGVFVQSVGGGGGVIGTSGDLLGLDPAFQGTAGGTGTAGNVTLVQDHDVSSTGLNSFGLLLQSAGGTGNGNINLTVTTGTTITGGSGTGAGVGFMGGVDNVFANNGTVTSINGIAGYAMTANTGNDTVDNFGTMIGSVDLGAGTNSFNNHSGSLFDAGQVVNLGAGNTLTNDGTISPGATGTVYTTAITGNLVQSAGGHYAIDLDFMNNISDRINVSGTSAVSGDVAISFLNTGGLEPGSHQTTILSSAGGVSDHTGLSLNVASSAIVTYELAYPDADDIDLTYNIDFKPPGLPGNLQSIGNTINQIQSAHIAGFGPITANLFLLPNVASLTGAYNALDGEGSAATQQTAITASHLFLSMMQDQQIGWFSGNQGGFNFNEETTGALQFAAKPKPATDAFAQLVPSQSQSDHWHGWVSAFGERQTIDGDTSYGTTEVTQSIYGGGFGVDRQMNRDYLLGVAVGVSGSSALVPDRATEVWVNGGHFGVYGETRRENWYVSGSLTYAYFSNRTQRTIAGVGTMETATGSFGSNQISGRVEVGRRTDFGQLAVTPFYAIEFAQLWQQGYTENSTGSTTGAPGVLGLTYAAQSTTSLPTSLGINLSSHFDFVNDMTLAPFARVAWVHEFETERQIMPSFNVAPGYSFVVSGASPASDLMRVNAGFDLKVNRSASIFAAVNGDFASNTHSYGVTGGYRVEW